LFFNFGHKLHHEKHNYSAGPCILPQEVLKNQQAILNFNDSGLSILAQKDFVGGNG
jgi:phosphoserine aminotransferase